MKYAPVAAVLAAIGLWALLRAGRRGTVLALAGALAAAGVAFLVVHQAIYGGVTPYASGSHFVDGELTVVGSPDYVGARAASWGCWWTRTSGSPPGSRRGCCWCPPPRRCSPGARGAGRRCC